MRVRVRVRIRVRVRVGTVVGAAALTAAGAAGTVAGAAVAVATVVVVAPLELREGSRAELGEEEAERAWTSIATASKPMASHGNVARVSLAEPA